MTVILAWNAHANHPSQQGRVVLALSGWITAETQVIALTEVKGARAALKRWAREHGFRLYQEVGTHDPADERGDTALLLRVKGKHAVKPRRDWIAFMGEAWTVFSHRVRHKPRRHRRATFLLPGGGRVRLSAEHWPTRGNRAAWDESYASALRFLDRRTFGIVVGDLNADHRAVKDLAEDVGGKVRGERPDWLIANRGARIDVTELGHGGSDHAALLYQVAA